MRGRLLRIFGLGFGLAVVLGGVIGSGIMRNPSVVANGFPDARWILLAWLGGGLVVLIDAMPTVELGAAIPLAGGPYSIVTRAIGPRFGFLIGWADWCQLTVSTGRLKSPGKPLGFEPITARYSPCVTSNFPIQNPWLSVTTVCGPSSAERPISLLGLPRVKVFDGMNTMFVGGFCNCAR